MPNDLLAGIAERRQKGIIDIHETSIRQRGEGDQAGIITEQPFEPLLRFLFRAQVLTDAEETILPVPLTKPNPRFNGHEGAILIHQRKGAAIPLALKHGSEDGLGFLPLIRRMHIQQMHTLEFFCRVAQRSRDCAVREKNTALRCAHHDHVGHGLKEGAEIRLALSQRLLGPLLSGNIPVCTDHTQGCTGVIALHHRESANKTDRPVWPQDPKFNIELLLSTQGEMNAFIATLAVFRMKPRLPSLVGTAELIPRNTVKLEHLVIPDEQVVDHVVVPDTHAARAHRQRQTGGDQQQGLFTLFEVNSQLARHSLSFRLGAQQDTKQGAQQQGAEDPSDKGQPSTCVCWHQHAAVHSCKAERPTTAVEINRQLALETDAHPLTDLFCSRAKKQI